MDSDAFQGRLMPGEKLVWMGSPKTGFMLTARDGFLIPFSLMWGGFAIFWEWSVLHIARGNGPDLFFDLWGVPFVLIGLYMIFGRFFVDVWARAHTAYGVTSQRILILRDGPFGKFTALAIDRLPELSLDERADGRGTIRFAAGDNIFGRRNSLSGWSPALDGTPQFLGIPDARAVFDRIQKLGRVTNNAV
jgi:hypothetical protein